MIIEPQKLNFYKRDDILFRAWVLTHELSGLWLKITARNKKLSKKPTRLFDIYKKTAASGQRRPVNVKTIGGEIYPVEGASRIASAIALRMPLEVIEYEDDWNEESTISKRPRFYTVENRMGIFAYMDEDTIEEFVRWKDDWRDDCIFIATVWPFVSKSLEKIQKVINTKQQVLSVNKVTFKMTWKEMLEGVYADDRIKSWKFDAKLKALDGTPRFVYVMSIRIPKPNYRLNRKGRLISHEVEGIKNRVRRLLNSSRKDAKNPIHIPDTVGHSNNYRKFLQRITTGYVPTQTDIERIFKRH